MTNATDTYVPSLSNAGIPVSGDLRVTGTLNNPIANRTLICMTGFGPAFVPGGFLGTTVGTNGERCGLYVGVTGRNVTQGNRIVLYQFMPTVSSTSPLSVPGDSGGPVYTRTVTSVLGFSGFQNFDTVSAVGTISAAGRTGSTFFGQYTPVSALNLSLIHISEPTRPY